MHLLLYIFIIFYPILSFASIPNEDCLGCHEKYIEFKHGNTTCFQCHKDISSLPHEDKLKKPVCNTCHGPVVEKYKKSIHSKRNLSCKDCHNVHFTTKDKKNCVSCHQDVAHKRLPVAERHIKNLDCLVCHGRTQQGEIDIEIHTGKKDIVKKTTIDSDGNNILDHIEWDNLKSMVNKELKGKEEIKKHYIVKIDDSHLITKAPVACKACHNDKVIFKKAKVTIQGKKSYTIPSDINIYIPELPSIEDYKYTVHGKKGVKCYDCHTSDTSISDDVCIKCHKGLYDIYKDTAHSEKGATQCTDCHNPHLIKTFRELNAYERVNICVRCHRKYLEKHKWLPNTILHFRYLECTSCHSPGSKKSMLFNFVIREEEGLRPLQNQDFKMLYGKDSSVVRLIDQNMDGIILYDELIDFFNETKKRLKKNLFIKSSIVVTNPFHNYSQKNLKNKVCNECHSENAPFYESMLIAVPEKKGVVYLPVKKTVLAAFPTSIFIDICLLGEGKIRPGDINAIMKANWKDKLRLIDELGFKLIDFIGISIALIILAGVAVHIILRIVVKK